MATIFRDPPLLLTEKQASELLNCCERTVSRMRQSGEIPFLKLRGAIRYSRADLLKFIESRSVTANTKCPGSDDKSAH
ncbi:helix-turn-helix domain-containing protein [Gimesia chilikensis]|uniref:helix-turn-helix domain-containing protein n=1 Tax=Gimesia chilikensis TaxID=2605989 RepID=UPI003A8D203E